LDFILWNWIIINNNWWSVRLTRGII
jgi:hypothetical protein